MKNKRKLLVSILAGVMALIILLGLILSIIPTAAAAQTSDEIREEIDALEVIQEELNKQMAELEARQNQNWSSIEELVEQKNNLDQQVNLLTSEIDNINAQLLYYTQLIADNQESLDAAQQRLDELNEKNKERIRAMEEAGEVSYWSVIFKASSFTDLIDRLNMMQEIQEADQRRMEALDAAAEAVAQARTRLEAEKEGLEASRLKLAEAQTVLDGKRAEADALLAELNANQRELDEMEADFLAAEEALVAEIAAAEAEYTKVKAEEIAEAKRKAEEEARKKAEEEKKKQEQANKKPNSSGWHTPCAYKSITSAYGWRTHPVTGKYSFHTGIDMANDKGTKIYAAKSGTVTTATYNSVYGYYVVINHGDGYSTLYGHMTNYTVSVGDTVVGGELIGYMGSTGWSTGSHLHYTVYYNGNTVNPANYI